MMANDDDEPPPRPHTPPEEEEEEEEDGSTLLPLLEIREMCDGDGKIIDAEVVNMSDAMRRLGGDDSGDGRAAEEEEGGEQGEGGRRRPSIPIESSNGVNAVMGDARRAVVAQDRADGMISHDKAHDSAAAVGPTTSDGAYEAIRTLLNELERMEEEDERSRLASKDSSVRLQGGGWSRGFLTKTKTKTTKETKKTEEEKSSSHHRAEGRENKEGEKGGDIDGRYLFLLLQRR